ncbi:kremen protein 2 [Crotalus adamanteus]|uniref:Kremen protein 2 n=1 Tax=Crotalus adamanteus TaxID=8729 RepID=A0AAW1B1E6_CROAD
MGACQGNFSDLSGVIYSPQFPDDYEANSNCSWILYPAGCDSIELSFRIFDVRDPNDRLEVRDGHSNLLLTQFDGRRRPGAPLLFPTDCLSLFFQSDQFLQDQGFAILYRGLKASSVNLRTLPGDGSHLAPTSSDWLNSTWTYSANDSAIGVGAWVMYTATGTFILAIIIVSYHLRKRTCLFVQKKMGNSLVPFSFKGPRNCCQCLGGEAWAVAYQHTRVVICTTRGGPHHRPLHNGGEVARGDDETSSDCSCLCHSYENLSSTNQSSLKSLISTI